MRKIVSKTVSAKDFVDPTEDYMGYGDFALHGMTEKDFIILAMEVDSIPIPKSGKTENKIVLVLEGAKKALILSKGKRKALVALFGKPDHWIGKKIKLVADPGIRYAGKITGGLRLEKA